MRSPSSLRARLSLGIVLVAATALAACSSDSSSKSTAETLPLSTLPATVANTDGCWLVGEQLSTTPLRYMTKPSKDGASKDAWSSTLGSLDVHYSSGPNNRMFFFLSQGASATAGALLMPVARLIVESLLHPLLQPVVDRRELY